MRMILSANTHILGIMTEGITNKISLNVEKESIPDLFGYYYLFKKQVWLDVWKTIMFVLFFFNIRFYVFISYNELYDKLLFSMQILCIGMYIYMYP